MRAPALSSIASSLFEVSATGTAHGLGLRLGDRLVLRTDDGPVAGLAVLRPRGRGAPVIGRVDGRRVYGAWNEPCSPDRWEVVGELVGVERSGPAGVLRLGLTQLRVAVSEPAVGQLPLFSRAA